MLRFLDEILPLLHLHVCCLQRELIIGVSGNSCKSYRYFLKQSCRVVSGGWSILSLWFSDGHRLSSWHFDWLNLFQILLWNSWSEINAAFTGSKMSMTTFEFAFWRLIEKTKCSTRTLIGRDIWKRLLYNRWTDFNESWQVVRIQCPLPYLLYYWLNHSWLLVTTLELN